MCFGSFHTTSLHSSYFTLGSTTFGEHSTILRDSCFTISKSSPGVCFTTNRSGLFHRKLGFVLVSIRTVAKLGSSPSKSAAGTRQHSPKSKPSRLGRRKSTTAGKNPMDFAECDEKVRSLMSKLTLEQKVSTTYPR